MATTAIEDAIEAGGHPNKIEAALKKLYKADKVWNESYPGDLKKIADKVFNKLEQSWEKAVSSYCE